MDLEHWKDHWRNTPIEVLRFKFTEDYVQETKFLADKAYAKFYWMSFGSIFFRLGLVAFILFIAVFFQPTLRSLNYLPRRVQ